MKPRTTSTASAVRMGSGQMEVGQRGDRPGAVVWGERQMVGGGQFRDAPRLVMPPVHARSTSTTCAACCAQHLAEGKREISRSLTACGTRVSRTSRARSSALSGWHRSSAHNTPSGSTARADPDSHVDVPAAVAFDEQLKRAAHPVARGLPASESPAARSVRLR